jgi:hypothetical protein
MNYRRSLPFTCCVHSGGPRCRCSLAAVAIILRTPFETIRERVPAAQNASSAPEIPLAVSIAARLPGTHSGSHIHARRRAAPGACPGYVIDHVEGAQAGAADVPSNMQWQTVQEAQAKDRI